MNSGHTYIIGSNTGTLYIGVTSELHHRICQHKLGLREGFAKDPWMPSATAGRAFPDDYRSYREGEATEGLDAREKAQPDPQVEPGLQRFG